MDDLLLTAFAKHLGEPDDAARPLLADLLVWLRATLDVEGQVSVEGLGTFRLQQGEVLFEADEALTAAVNQSFAGLPPIARPDPLPDTTAADEAEDSRTDEAIAATAETVAQTASRQASETYLDRLQATLAPVPLEDAPEAPPHQDSGDGAAPTSPGSPSVLTVTDPGTVTPEPPAPDLEPEAPEREAADPDAAFLDPAPPAPNLSDSEDLPPLRNLASDSEALAEPAIPTDSHETDADTPTREDLAGEADAPPTDLIAEDADDSVEPEDNAPAVAVPELDTDEDPEDLTDAGTEATEPEAASEDEDLEDDLDAVLAGVWAPADEPTDAEHPLGRASEPAIEEADFAVVGATTASETTPEPSAPAPEPVDKPGVDKPGEEHARVSPPLAATRAATAPERAPVPGEREPSRRRSALVWVPLLLAVCTVLVIALWPQFSSRPTGAPAFEPPRQAEAVAPAEEATTTPDASESAALPAADEAEADDAVSETADGESAVGETPAATPPPATSAAAPPPSGDASIPAPFRGPGEIDPTQGGATWVIVSGGRAPAEQIAARYRRQGYRASALRATVNGRPVYRVGLGQFASAEEALRYESALPYGLPDPTGAWVLRLGGTP